MFAKIFSQIFDSTIAENWRHRHVFMDLLVLADVDGCVNITTEAIARRTNVPFEMVQESILALSAPDPSSQNREHEGRRLIPIEAGRDWGWRIVSYHQYRAIRDEEARRQYHRDYRRKERAEKKAKNRKKKSDPYALLKHPDHPGTPLIPVHSPRLDPNRLGPSEPPV